MRRGFAAALALAAGFAPAAAFAMPTANLVTSHAGISGSAVRPVTPASKQPSLTIVSLNSATVGSEDVTLTVRLNNPTSESITISSLRLAAQSSIATSRVSVLRFMDGKSYANNVLTTDVTPATVYANDYADLTITAPRASLPAGNSAQSWGAIGMEVTAFGTEYTLSDRTMAIIAPTFEIAKSPVSALVAVNSVSSWTLEEATNPGSPRTNTPEISGFTATGVTLALDSASARDSALTAKLKGILASSGTKAILSARANADISSISSYCEANTDCLTQWLTPGSAVSATQSETLSAALGTSVPDDITVLDSSANSATADALAATGVTKAIAPASSFPTDNDTRATPSGRAHTSSTALLVTDTAMNAALAGKLPKNAAADVTQEDSAEVSALNSRQLALALSATTYRERPNDPRLMVVQADAATVGADEAVRALLTAPWVRGVTLDEAYAMPEAPAERAAVTEAPASPSLTQASMSSLSAAATDMRKIAGIANESTSVSEAVESRLAELVSLGWPTPAERTRNITAFAHEAEAVRTGIMAQPSSTINVISNKTEIPVILRSSLPVGVTVQVDLHSWDPRLSTKIVEVSIPAYGTSKALIPIEAFGNGNVTAQIRVLGKDGHQVGSPAMMNVRLRSNWEDIGTYTFVGFFSVLLVVGVWRSLRKGRRSRPVSPVEIRQAITKASKP